jgi:hypothetical protein
VNYLSFFHRRTRPVPVDILLTLFFAGFVFVLLLIVTGGLVVSLITAAVATAVFALFHYLVWGQFLLKTLAKERRLEDTRARLQVEQAMPADEFCLTLTDAERLELIGVLEDALAGAASARRAQSKETIQEMLDRLRGFGA